MVQVAGHPIQELFSVADRDAELAAGIRPCQGDRVFMEGRGGEGTRPPSSQGLDRILFIPTVDGVIADATKSIKSPDRTAFFDRQESGGQRKGPAVPAGDSIAKIVSLFEKRVVKILIGGIREGFPEPRVLSGPAGIPRVC